MSIYWRTPYVGNPRITKVGPSYSCQYLLFNKRGLAPGLHPRWHNTTCRTRYGFVSHQHSQGCSRTPGTHWLPWSWRRTRYHWPWSHGTWATPPPSTPTRRSWTRWRGPTQQCRGCWSRRTRARPRQTRSCSSTRAGWGHDHSTLVRGRKEQTNRNTCPSRPARCIGHLEGGGDNKRFIKHMKERKKKERKVH